jgi:hypothetical protein
MCSAVVIERLNRRDDYAADPALLGVHAVDALHHVCQIQLGIEIQIRPQVPSRFSCAISATSALSVHDFSTSFSPTSE